VIETAWRSAQFHPARRGSSASGLHVGRGGTDSPMKQEYDFSKGVRKLLPLPCAIQLAGVSRRVVVAKR
jgi:hypothetical protein